MRGRHGRLPGPPGILLVDKPSGITSAAATRALEERFGFHPVGHTGTLDPAATGLLVVCTGYATRLVPWLQEGEKLYQARLRFGIETDTDDAEGGVVRTAEVPGDLEDLLRGALPGFLGPQLQAPPAISALRVEGRRAHVLARRGELGPGALEPRAVVIFELTLDRVEDCEALLRVRCSPGTYVRALARDLGRALGTAAHLASLRREGTGGFSVAAAGALATILAGDAPSPWWRPLPEALPHWPRRTVEAPELDRVLNGGVLDRDGPDVGPVLLLGSDGTALGVAEPEGEASLRVRRLLLSRGS